VVLIVPNASTLNLTSFSDLAQDKVTKVSIGDPASVPAGTYAKEAFELLGIYGNLESRLVLGANVRQVLAYVETGDVDAGVVFSTDALISDKVKVVANAPDEVNSKIVYPAAVIKSSENADAARDYMEFLTGAKAKAAFEKYGFSLVGS
jgi:molybdate transport system substrate-binding protein